jgi:hypothetical protein
MAVLGPSALGFRKVAAVRAAKAGKDTPNPRVQECDLVLVRGLAIAADKLIPGDVTPTNDLRVIKLRRSRFGVA